MNYEVGEAAGRIWQFLNDHPNATLEQVHKAVETGNGLVYMALGWLAREDKLTFEGQGKKMKISLK